MSTTALRRGPTSVGVRVLAAIAAATILVLGITSPVLSEGEATGQISATIVSDTDGQPLVGARLCAFGSEFSYPCDTAGETGTIDFPALTPGSYRLEAWQPDGPHLGEYYEDAYGPRGWDGATLVDVVAGQTTTVHIGLFEPGQIQGTVTASATSTPLGGIEVCAQPMGEQDDLCDETAPDGTYDIIGVGPYEHWVVFTDPSSGYVRKYHAGAKNMYDATMVTVPSGSSVTVDASLDLGGSISGTVTDETDLDPVQGIEVCAHNEDFGACSATDVDGSYFVGGLDTGAYEVSFRDDEDRYLREYYDDASSWDDTTLVTIETPGAAVTNIDAALTRASIVSGSLVGPGASRDSAFEVYLYEMGTDDEHSVEVDDGAYTINGLTPGVYRAAVIEWGPSGVSSTWYGGGSSVASAAYFTVGRGQEVTGIDFEITAHGSISGAVTISPGVPAPSGTVVLLDETFSIASETPITDGSYGFDTVSPGRYLVVAHVPGHPALVSTDSSGVASPVEITATGESLTGIDLSHPHDAQIIGVVTDSAGQPYSQGYTVEFWADSDVWLPTAAISFPAGGGEFHAPSLPEGPYRVRVIPGDDTHRPTWNGGVADRWSSTTVVSDCCSPPTASVQLLPSTRPLIISLDQWWGTEVAVSVFAEGVSWLPTSSGVMTASGVTIANLPPGRYQVRISGLPNTTMGSKWYGDVTNRIDSPFIDLTGPGGPVEISTTYPSYISVLAGHVVGGGRAGGGATVSLFGESATWVPDHQAVVGADGRFEIRGVAPGNYRMLVTSPDPSLGPIWYGNTTLRSEAKVIEVVGEESDRDIFVQLPTL